MTSDNPIRFTLADNTLVVVKELTNNKYDFEMILPNGNRTTFLWLYGSSYDFEDKHGNIDEHIMEALVKFCAIKE